MNKNKFAQQKAVVQKPMASNKRMIEALVNQVQSLTQAINYLISQNNLLNLTVEKLAEHADFDLKVFVEELAAEMQEQTADETDEATETFVVGEQGPEVVNVSND